MGAPFWSEEERSYFIDIILPMSKYAGGSYSNSEGMDFSELATIMQTELDRRGTSRRQYTGDMLFQHYYQKCSARSYKRGEGDQVAPDHSMSRASSASMGPPPRPNSRRRPLIKEPSIAITYGHASTQTALTVLVGSESELAFQDYPQYSGPPAVLYETISVNSGLRVQPVATSSKKRNYQVTVEDDNDDDDDYFPLRDEYLEAAMQPVVRKQRATRARATFSENESKTSDGICNSMDEISKLLKTQPSEPERHRPAKLQNPWAPSFGTRPRTPLGRTRGFASPKSDTQSEDTSSIAYKTYTPSLSFDRLSSTSDTSRPSRHRRSMAKSLLEDSSRAPSRASNVGDSGHGTFQAVRSPLREPSRSSNREELGPRGASPVIPRVGPSRVVFRGDSHTPDFNPSPQRESSRAASFSEQSKTSRISHSPPRRSVANGSPRYDEDVSWYHRERRGSPSGPTRYQGLGSRNQDSNDVDPIHRSAPESFRSSSSLEPHAYYTPTPDKAQPEHPVTGDHTSLPSFRKRSKQQPSPSFPQPERTTQPSRPNKRRVSFNPFIHSGSDDE